MEKFDKFFKARAHVLEHIVAGGDIYKTLDILCRDTEDFDPVMRCTVLLLDQEHKCLHSGAAPSLPDYYNNAIDGEKIGVGAGSCGTAASTGERVIVEDVYSHPYWVAYRELAKKVGFHACWSQPIFSKNKAVLGTFAMYFDEVRSPTEQELELIQAQANLASIAIERKLSEDAILESEARLILHIQNTPVGAISWDCDFQCTEWNNAAENIFGYTAAEAIGQHAAEIILPAGLREDVTKVISELLTQKGGRRNTNENVRKDGETIICDWYNTPIFDRSGKVTGVASLVQDITVSKRTEAQLIKAKEVAENANKAKSEFLASMSHELRTPLNAVLGFAQMMQFDPKNPLAPAQKEHIESIVTGGNHLLALVNDILDLARIEADQPDLSWSEVDAKEVIADCISLISPLGNQRSIEFIDKFSAGSSALLFTDKTRLKQVLINLLSNAVKFNKAGGTVAIESQERDNDYLRILVTDSGVGIADEDFSSVFRLFHRLGADSKIAKEGTGIGLTVSKLLMERMAGRIGFESKKGIGSTFWIDLPLTSNSNVLIWTDALQIGVDAIDTDHQFLTHQLNRLMHRSIDDADLDKLISGFINFVNYHFKREEVIMDVCGYAGFEKHQDLHRQLFTKLNDQTEAWNKERCSESLIHFRNFLKTWLFDHILNQDTKITLSTKDKAPEIRKALDASGLVNEKTLLAYDK